MDDIIEAIKKLDGLSRLPNFVARNVVKIPDRQPEELNILYDINRINNLEKEISVDEALLNNYNFFVKINTELLTHKNLIVVNNEVNVDFLKMMLDKKSLSDLLDDIIMTKVSNVLYKKKRNKLHRSQKT